MSYWVYDEVFSCMYDVGVYCHWMDVLLMYVVGYGCHVDVCSKWWWLWSSCEFNKYVWGYGTSHVHCTSRLILGLLVRSYNV